MENKINVEELLAAFTFEGELENITQLHDGHINNTYVFDFDNGGEINRYLVQELNTYVFKDHEGLMNNVLGVTAHMQKLFNSIRQEDGTYDVSKVDEKLRSIYIGVEATSPYSLSESVLQGEDSGSNSAPIQIDLTYTLVK